jgi:DNA polymerase III subunit delta
MLKYRRIKLPGEYLLYILYGEDEFSLEEALQEIKKSLGDPSMLSFNTTVLEGAQLNIDQLEAVARSTPFLSEKRLVIINGLLERFEPRTRTGAAKKSDTASNAQDESRKFTECLSRLPDSTVAVLTDASKIRPANSLLKALTGKAEIKSFPLLRGTRLSQWVQDYASRQGGRISQQALGLLIELAGGNLRMLAGEISKLIAYTSGRLIEEKDVRAAVASAQESDIFGLVDAVLEYRTGAAERTLQQLLQNGMVPAYILVMLARQVQMIVQVKDLQGQKKAPVEIQTRLGISSDFVWRKVSEQAKKYTPERLKYTYRRLLDTDVAVKTGKYTGELAMEMLVVELCEHGS